MCKQPIYWASIGLLAAACILAIAAFSLSIHAGLNTNERIELNAARMNISEQQTTSKAILEASKPYQAAVDNTSDVIEQNKLRDVPTLQECQRILDESAALLAEKTQALQQQLETFDLTRLDVLPPLIDAAEESVEMLAMDFQYTGVLNVLQTGTFLLYNEANQAENINMTYTLEQMQFPQGARLYFIRVPPSTENLEIQTVTGPTAALVFGDWFPPLALGGGLSLPPTHIDPILDDQRGRIDTTPSRLVFKQREYDLEEQIITVRDTTGNFTVGEQVRVRFEISMNVGFL